VRLVSKEFWQRGGLTWKELGIRLWRQIWLDEILGRCAELAYFFLFSVFPLLLFLTALLGYVAGASSRLRLNLFRYIAQLSPSRDVTELLFGTLNQIQEARTGTKLWLSLVAAVWVASNGMIAVGRTLNTACGLKETRRWYIRRGVGILLTIAFAVLIISALTLILWGGDISRALAGRFGYSDLFSLAWQLLQWPLVLFFAILSFEIVYNYTPNLGSARHRQWGTPGAVVAVILWLIASFGLRSYLQYFRTFSTAYGSLGAVILLLLWFYLTAFAILMGGEVNSEIGNEIARRNELEGKPLGPPTRRRSLLRKRLRQVTGR
jgi:membrane protein